MRSTLWQIIKLFTKLGFIAFGGPAAHIAMMEDEVVTKRKWMSRSHFLDLVGATNLIPGPNSTEMAIHTGYHKAGIAGLLLAGICFILPAVLSTAIFAWLYVTYGELPGVETFLYGIKPAVLVIIFYAVYKFGRTAISGGKLFAIAMIVAIINLAGVNEIFSIFIGGMLGFLLIYLSSNRNNLNTIISLHILSFTYIGYFLQNLEKSEASITKVFLVFLKIGAVLFGSGYVLIAYLNGEIVQGLNWITEQQLIDAIAIGQITPGPVLSTATFVGYQIAGVYGAIAATIGIFLPSFIFVLILNPIVPKLRNSKIFSMFLDAINVSVVAVMFVVAIRFSAELLTDWPSITIAVVTTITVIVFKKLNSAYLVLLGSLLGYFLTRF